MKTICLIIHSLGIGGMERVMAQLATNFCKGENVKVHLVLIGIKREVRYDLPDSVIIHRPGFPFSNRRRMIDTIRTVLYLRSEVKKIGPDSVLSFGEMWNNLVLLSLYGLTYPVYVSDRSQPDKDLGRFHNQLKSLLYPKAAGFIAQTGKAAEVCIEKGWNRNVKVIGNPVREIEADPAIKKENIVLFVGRLIPTKHVDQLIRIFTDIGKKDWKLFIVGGNAKRMNLMEELQNLIEELGAQGSIKMEGEQQDVERYYNRSKVFAFTSSSEGFPNVIGEALSSGLPVVAYDCDAGPSDMIQDGENGFLIDLFDQNKFTEKLTLLMQNGALMNEMGIEAKKSIEKFNVDVVADQFYKFLNGAK